MKIYGKIVLPGILNIYNTDFHVKININPVGRVCHMHKNRVKSDSVGKFGKKLPR